MQLSISEVGCLHNRPSLTISTLLISKIFKPFESTLQMNILTECIISLNALQYQDPSMPVLVYIFQISSSGFLNLLSVVFCYLFLFITSQTCNSNP